ncbi:MAG: hypothetical protein JHC93_02510 [Parachlamydiales bacterium]|nr:hypothetical protein [Parachlamydiales bacterium]
MKKRYALLLEALIALTLFTILCSVLFGAYRRLTTVKRESKVFLEKCLDQGHLQSTMKILFNSLLRPDSETPKKNEKDQKEKKSINPDERFYFYTAPPIPGETVGLGLVFTFDNQLDISEEFSSSQIAHLFLDREHNLKLAYWPSLWERDQNLFRQETLFKHVEKIEFEFYTPPYTNNDIIKDKPLPGYSSTWDNRFKELPTIVTLKIELENQERFDYRFVLHQADRSPNFAAEGVVK